MRVSFDVHGTTREALEREAERILAAFTNDTPQWVTICAAPEESAVDGTVINWRGEVEAQV